MKFFYLIYFFLSFAGYSQSEFITTWEVDGNDLEITIPTTGTGYDYQIDFGDGNLLTASGNISHTYDEAGIYTVKISGDFPRIYFNNTADKNKIRSVEQWGNVEWQSMERAFYGCTYLTINATDAPLLSQATNLNEMFRSAYNLNQPINHWDVSHVTSMSHMFSSAIQFNQPLDGWDVSNVEDFSFMFSRAESFNQNIDDWDVGNANNFSHMFSYAATFNQPLGSWNMSQAEDLQRMFKYAESFNRDINTWDVSNVIDFYGMFRYASSFNQPLNNWEVSNAKTMITMFADAIAFNQPLDNWDISQVINMSDMFANATEFNQDLSTWNFNDNVLLTYSYPGFIGLTSIDVENYDALLNQFILLNLSSRLFIAQEIYYCDEVARQLLTEEMNWNIEGDNLYENCLELNVPSQLEQKFYVYPNPAKSSIYLKKPANVSIEKITMFNLNGQKVDEFASSNLEIISLHHLPKGNYFLDITTSAGQVMKIIIIE